RRRPPWSVPPLAALNDAIASTALRRGSSATQRLKRALRSSVVWANARPVLDGAVSSATTFQMLAPLPVWAAFQPVGTLPTSSLLNFTVRSLSSAAQTAPPNSATTAAAFTHRMVLPPRKRRVEGNRSPRPDVPSPLGPLLSRCPWR